MLPDGEPVEVEIHVLTVPAGADLERDTWQALQRGGATTVRIYAGPDIWPRGPARSDPDAASGGYTAVTFEGVQVGVQNQGDRCSRLAWVKPTAREAFNVEAYVPLDPLAAAQALTRSLNAP